MKVDKPAHGAPTQSPEDSSTQLNASLAPSDKGGESSEMNESSVTLKIPHESSANIEVFNAEIGEEKSDDERESEDGSDKEHES